MATTGFRTSDLWVASPAVCQLSYPALSWWQSLHSNFFAARTPVRSHSTLYTVLPEFRPQVSVEYNPDSDKEGIS